MESIKVSGIVCTKIGVWEHKENIQDTLCFKPNENQLLIKMISAPINPSDFLLKDGYYPAPK